MSGAFHHNKEYYMDFVEFLAALAPEGETALIVQQKKKAWVPQLPTATRRDGLAWYGNTGSFILDRMTAGLTASASCCKYGLISSCSGTCRCSSM